VQLNNLESPVSSDVKFHLNEFRAVARWLESKLPAPLAFVLKGYLWKLEDVYIDAKASSAASEAIRVYSEGVDTPEGLTAPERHTEASEVDDLDIIEIRSPWTSNNSKPN
jgi:hypothetical protein